MYIDESTTVYEYVCSCFFSAAVVWVAGAVAVLLAVVAAVPVAFASLYCILL